MAQANILESYLVSLSMKGPSASEQREAEKAFDTIAQAVATVAPTIAAAAAAIVYATDKIAAGLGKLYFESQKTGATVREITALGYAFEQNGSTLEKFHADFDKFAQTLRDFPAYRTMLRDRLGLKPEDFKDDITTYSAALKALAAKRAAGDTQTEGAFRNLFGFDEDNIIARGRKEFDKFYAEGFERNKGIDEIAVKALALVRSLNAFGAALEAVGRKASAALFDKYGIVLGDMTKWVDDHSNEIVAAVTEVVDQLVLAWKDIEPVAVPAVHLIAIGLDRTAAALDRLLGPPDGQHGGLHAVRYVLDDLAAYIAGKWAIRLLGLLGLRGIGGAALGALGIGGVAAVGAGAAAAGVLGAVPKAEGDDSYGLDHPGWHPGMPKEKTSAQKAAEAGAASTLTPAAGREAQIAGVDKRLMDSLAAGAAHLPPGYRVEPFSGYSPTHGSAGSKHRLGEAVDVNIIGPDGKAIPNRGDDATGMYRKLARYTYGEMLKRYPELAPRFAHGAQFGTSRGSGVPDLMHYDIGGARRSPGPQFSPTIQELGPITEETKKPESRLELRDMHSKLAALLSHPDPHATLASIKRPVKEITGRNQYPVLTTLATGAKMQKIQINLASTDPHTAASEIARHMRYIHAENFKNLHRPFGHGSSIDRVRGAKTDLTGGGSRGTEHNEIMPPGGSSRDEVQSTRHEKYGRRGI